MDELFAVAFGGTALSILARASVYRSLPLAWLRACTEGKSVVLLSQTSDELQSLLTPSSVVTLLGVKALDEYFQTNKPSQHDGGVLLLTELTDAESAIDDANILFEIAQRFETIVFPWRCGKPQPQICWYGGASYPEANGTDRWVWADTATKELSFSIKLPIGVPYVLVSLTLCSAGDVSRDVEIQANGLSCSFRIQQKLSITYPIWLKGPVATVTLSANGPLVNTSDGRKLSFAVLNCCVTAPDRETILADSAAYEGFVSPRLRRDSVVLRERLHLFGFFEVGGVLASSDGLTSATPLASSRSLPSLARDHAALAQAFVNDPIADSGRILWVWASSNSTW